MQFISTRSHFKQTLFLALPVCLSNVGNITVDLADNFFIGMLPDKTTGQAAVALASALYLAFLVLAIGIAYGLTPIVAEANAQKNKSKIISHLKNAFLQNISASLILFFILFLCAPLLHYAHKPIAVTNLAVKYLNVMMFSLIPLSLFFTGKQFSEGMSNTKAAMMTTIAANALNIFLNWILVFGRFGFPHLGVMGACWSTFISRCFMAVAMVAYVYFIPRYREYRAAFTLKNFSWQPIREQLRIGLPSGIMFVLEVGAFAVPTLFIPGTPMLAAHRIALSLASVSYMISSGLGAAATIRVGHFLGLKDKTGIRRAGFSAMALSLMSMSTSAIIFILFRHQLLGAFNDDPEVLQYAIPLLLVAAAFQLFDGAQVTLQGALRGLKDTVRPGVIAFVAYWIAGLPVSWFLCTQLGWGVQGVWYGFVCGLAVASVGFLWRFNKLSSVEIK